MKLKNDSREQPLASNPRLIRGTASTELRIKPRSLGRRLRAFVHRGEEGNALVEFAIVLPILLLLTSGILIFGIAMNNYLQLTNAVSIGARTVAINGGLTKDPCLTASNAVIAAAPGLASSGLGFSFNFNGTTATSTSCTGDAAALASGTTVTVTATYPLNLSVYGAVFSAKNAVLTASATELVQ